MKLNKSIYSIVGLKWCVASFLILLSLNSCKKAVEIPPSRTQLLGDNVFTSNGSAESVGAGLFAAMSAGVTGGIFNGQSSISILMGLYADELANYTTSATNYGLYYSNNLNSQVNTSFWADIYKDVFLCNTIIAGLSGSTGSLTPAIRQQLLGEAKFSRAFLYFYAANLFGDTPLALTTDYTVNNTITRSPKAQVYAQVVQDLKDAQGLLSDGSYLNGAGAATTDRVRPNKQAASAMLARVYLYLQDWQNAEAQATNVINTPIYVLEPNLGNAFLKATREAIWQIQPVVAGYNNGDAVALVVNSTPGTSSVSSQLPLNQSLVNAFEAGDTRFTNWVGKYNAVATKTTPATTYYFANKYKVNSTSSATVTEYPIILRLAEQYLIRAEARAQQGNITGAQADLNVIRSRAGLAATRANTQSTLVTAVLHERQVELFTEWGHRWFDLKRTGNVDAVLSIAAPLKGGTWNTSKQLVPIPTAEILINPNLTQNPGY